MFGFARYNFDTFRKDVLTADLARLKAGEGPEPGEKAPDFKGRTLEGEKVRLSDFHGERNVVLTFGSATCPLTAASIRGMNELCREFRSDDVECLFVYVREAHPGDELPAHRSWDDKARAAELLRDEEGLEMPIIVDDTHGTIHKKYGRHANPTYIIDKSGRVAFRMLVTRPRVVEEALEELLERQRERGIDHAVVHGGEDRRLSMAYPLLYAHRAIERGGPRAEQDFREAMGMPGRMTLAASRMAEPIALHPVRTAAAAALTGGVIAAALYAGLRLRESRERRREPYYIHERPPRGAEGGEYEAVGI